MTFHPPTLQELAQKCRTLKEPCSKFDETVALATGWTCANGVWTKGHIRISDVLGRWFVKCVDPPPFTHFLDMTKFLISSLEGFTHFGVLHKDTGDYRAYITVYYPELNPANRMYSGIHSTHDVLSLCEAALLALADTPTST